MRLKVIEQFCVACFKSVAILKLASVIKSAAKYFFQAEAWGSNSVSLVPKGAETDIGNIAVAFRRIICNIGPPLRSSGQEFLATDPDSRHYHIF
jgi:hypothetical protein